MKTEALIIMRDEARAGLFPFQDERLIDGKLIKTNFYTEVLGFHSYLQAVFWELENNSIDFNAEVTAKYAGHAIDILIEARDQVNKSFHKDEEYNNEVRQIAMQDFIYEPSLEYTAADSLSEVEIKYPIKETALYINKICQWGIKCLQRYIAEPGAEIELPELDTIYEKLLLLEYSGVYEQIYNICGQNKKRTADLIALITGEKPGPIRVISSHLGTPHIKSRVSPYTISAIDKTIALLIKFRLDPIKLVKISEKIHSEIKK